MNGYALFYMAAMDDIPVGLYATMREARAAAKSLAPEECPITNAAARVMHREFSITSGVAVAKFRHGKLVKWTVLRMFDEEAV